MYCLNHDWNDVFVYHEKKWIDGECLLVILEGLVVEVRFVFIYWLRFNVERVGETERVGDHAANDAWMREGAK